MIKNNDFVEIDYTAKIKDSGEIFDLTDEKLAKEKGMFDSSFKYGSRIICVGQRFVIKGLDDSLIGKKEDSKFTVELKPEDAFGVRSSELMQIIPLKDIHSQKIQPFPGLKLNFGGVMGVVRSVSGGRVTVDFNHPLAGKIIVYDVKIGKIVNDDEKKLRSVIESGFGVEAEIKKEKEEYLVKLHGKLPEKLKKGIIDKCKEIIPKVKMKVS